MSLPIIISINKIWSYAYHNAMPDIIYFQNHFFCCFRESNSHVGNDNGMIRILISSDALHWESITLLRLKDVDLRDPMLSVTPEGKLMLNAGGSIYKKKRYYGCNPCVAFSSNGHEWSDFVVLDMPNEWIWRITWYNGVAYGASYRLTDIRNPRKPWELTLFKSHDGLSYNHVTPLNLTHNPSETTLRFTKEGTMIAMVRRQARGMIGTAKPPYIFWDWFKTDYSFGGPNFIILPDSTMWAGSRMVVPKKHRQYRTVLAEMGTHHYKPVLEFPSGGDTSYPGMIYHNHILYMCYYSSHEGKSMIYLAQINVER